jgi:16S rRNA (guanine527-N7)-methyltransferase
MSADLGAFDAALASALERWALSLSADQSEMLRAHFSALLDANRHINLTRITEPVEAAVKHYADSLAVLPWMGQRRLDVDSVLDIGTGAGFPALPLAALRPHWDITAIEATAKKARFLRDAINTISAGLPEVLTKLEVVHTHSAHWPSDRGFDLVVSRASARLAVFLEQAARRTAPNGWIVAYKTEKLEAAEAEPADQQAAKLRLAREPVYPYTLTLAGETLHRALYVYRKEAVS